MMLGVSLGAFTTLHVLISLVGIGTGFVVLAAMGRGTHLPGWTLAFLLTTLLTTVTGFLFPLTVITPAVLFGIISLIVLLPVFYALYGAKLAGPWRRAYAVGASVALYLNAFVLIVQSFLKIPFLHQLAPTGKEPPFAIAQLLLLALMVWLAIRALRRFRPGAAPP